MLSAALTGIEAIAEILGAALIAEGDSESDLAELVTSARMAAWRAPSPPWPITPTAGWLPPWGRMARTACCGERITT